MQTLVYFTIYLLLSRITYTAEQLWAGLQKSCNEKRLFEFFNYSDFSWFQRNSRRSYHWMIPKTATHCVKNDVFWIIENSMKSFIIRCEKVWNLYPKTKGNDNNSKFQIENLINFVLSNECRNAFKFNIRYGRSCY